MFRNILFSLLLVLTSIEASATEVKATAEPARRAGESHRLADELVSCGSAGISVKFLENLPVCQMDAQCTYRRFKDTTPAGDMARTVMGKEQPVARTYDARVVAYCRPNSSVGGRNTCPEMKACIWSTNISRSDIKRINSQSNCVAAFAPSPAGAKRRGQAQ